MKIHQWCFLFAVVLLSPGRAAASGDDGELRANARERFKPVPRAVSQLKGKPLTSQKIELGKLLFFDPRLSASALISCNTCHNLGMGGADFQETSIGHGWQKGPRNAPTVFNAVFNVAQFWDGRAKDLKEQAQGPVQASVEMNNTPEGVIRVLTSMPEYVARFKEAFPGRPDPVTFENMADAIAAFEATLLTPDSKFDLYLKQTPEALSSAQKEGLTIFMEKGCVNCHGGTNLGGEAYYPFGLVEKPRAEIMAGDVGRYKITHTKSDEYVFKAPSLRNVALTPPYFHSGRVWSLEEAVRIMGSAQLGDRLTPLEAGRITDFLAALNGVPPEIDYPVLPKATGKTPKPKLD